MRLLGGHAPHPTRCILLILPARSTSAPPQVTLIMILDKSGTISYDGKAIGYVVTELASTIIFCLITVGNREHVEGLSTFASSFASTITSDHADLLVKSAPARKEPELREAAY